MKKALLLLFCTALIGFTSSCLDNDNSGPAIRAQAQIDLNTENEIPIVENRDETGTFLLNLFDDNTMEFSITVDNLSSSDDLTAAHIHTGDPVSTGGVAITLVDGTTISFQGNKATGTLQLTDTEVATLLGGDVYVNVHSTENPSGLVRGQLDQVVTEAYNVMLSPTNEIPSITDREDSGTAIFRIVGNKVYYKVSVMDLKAGDAITAGHIHEGDATVNGGVLINLELADETQLGITKSLELESSMLTQLKNDDLYVNIHSTDHPSGLMRGQIR
ncbi:CHRD domain-containing protein [Aureibaculum sp. 2210JD6-5]|uniref:CHRD domain-containing protein n=1 Tax=Aureibaculum sp. 2210JD6-5 TaxID=3103957 RepID=UPI002AAC7509|nr:CHRD domain-containing protein [Aureibaculum sp. 2210JD6-5]MDY7396121.1 CHRD domain-containing protein [Aureibaculum sp. 2210JD6-5]